MCVSCIRISCEFNYAFNLTIPEGSLVSVTTNTSYWFLLPSLRQLYGNDSLTLDAGVPLEELAADISIRMRELKEYANNGAFSNIYDAAVMIMDPVVWIWFTILSMTVGINLIVVVNNWLYLCIKYYVDAVINRSYLTSEHNTLVLCLLFLP